MQFPNIASKLKSATTNINIASASTPSNGQVLTATSSTTATWQIPAWAWNVASTKSTFVAWENITAWNALYIHTDWKAYKTDASNSSKINFIWFATNTVSSWWNVIVDTSWVSSLFSWLSLGLLYYLAWWITLTSQLLTYDFINIWYSTSTYDYKEWQTFTLSNWTKWVNIKVQLRKVWAPTDNIIIKLYDSDKTTLLWTSNSISWTTLTTSWIDYIFTINWINLLASTTYFISVERTWAVSTSNYYNIMMYKNASNVYPNWATYTYNNSTSSWDLYVYWGDYIDFYFSITDSWDWAISITPWTNNVKVGRAVKTTDLLINTWWF